MDPVDWLEDPENTSPRQPEKVNEGLREFVQPRAWSVHGLARARHHDDRHDAR